MFGHYRSDNFVFRLPHSYEGDPKTYFNSTSTAFTCSLLAVATSAILILQYEAASRNAARGVDLAKAVTKQLLKYDTDGVKETVLAYQASERARVTEEENGGEDDNKSNDDADQLAESFLSMAENLDRYRPHLPNWLLSAVTQQQQHKNGKTHNNKKDEEEEDDEEDEDGADIMIMTSCSGGGNGVSATSNESARAVSGDEQDATAQLGAGSSSPSPSSGEGALVGAESAPSVGPRRVIPDRVSLVLLEYDVELLESALIIAHADKKKKKKASSSSGGGPSATNSLERFHAFVERVYELVNEHGGAVHSFVLQRITVSFNGVSRVEGPEMRAVRFVDALFREYPSLTSHDEATGALLESALSVAVSSGRVEDCGIVSTNNDENRSFILSLGEDAGRSWFLDLEGMLDVAQQSDVSSICVSGAVVLNTALASAGGQLPDVAFLPSTNTNGAKRTAVATEIVDVHASPASADPFWTMHLSSRGGDLHGQSRL